MSKYITPETIECLLEEAEQICLRERLAPSTVTDRLSALAQLLRNTHTVDAEAINEWLRSYINPRTQKSLGPHGKNRYLLALKWLLNRTAIIPDGKILARHLKREKCPESPGKALAEDEIETILQYAPDSHHELAFRLMIECGLRPHEVLSIRVKDIQLSVTQVPAEKTSFPWGVVHLPAENPVTPSKKTRLAPGMSLSSAIGQN